MKHFFSRQKKDLLLQAWIFLSTAALLYAGFIAPEAKAAFDPISGWAWSDKIGWISFSSKNCDTNGNGSSDGNISGCPPPGTTIAPYGVEVDGVAGTVRGYAWSDAIGWISFNASDVSTCPEAPCAPTFNKKTGTISGWARAIANSPDWDGFIHLRGSNYGVSVTQCDWDGYAWGSEVIGWIKFKGTNYGVKAAGNACQTSNDLLISAHPTTNETPVHGNNLTFSATVKNDGTGTINSTFSNQFKIDIDNDGKFDVTLPTGPASQVATPLESGATKTVISDTWTNIPLGTHRAVVCADTPGSTVDEFDETNNCSDTSGSGGVFTVLTKPDLVINSGPSPVGAGPFVDGLPMTFEGTVKNQGGSTANSTFGNTFTIDLENNGSNDASLSPHPTVSSLASGATSATLTSGSWTAVAGTHKVTFCSDNPASAINESNETNNCSSSTFTVLTKSNLIVANGPVVESGSLIAGQDLTFSGDIRNTGEATASGTFASHFDVDQNNDGTIDLNFDPDPKLSDLPQNTSAKVTSLSSWNDIPPGTHKVRLCADAKKNITESDENDNCATTLITVSTKPDLVIFSGPKASGTMIQGSSLTFSGTVKNQGGSTAGGTFSNRFEIDDFDNGGTAIVLSPNPQITALASEGTADITSGTWANIPAGTHKATLCTDTGSVANESNEANNCASITFTVATKADLKTTVPTVSGTLIEGYALTFTSNISNSGETGAGSFNSHFCIDSSNCQNSAEGRVGDNDHTTASLDGGASTGTITSAAWTASAGNHTVYFCADTKAAIDESNEDNCANKSFTVANQTLSISSFTATPDTGIRPLEVSLSASVSGTALGNTNYSFWWDCANTATTISGASSACGNLPTGVPAGQCVANDKGAKCEAITESSIDAGTYAALKHTYAKAGTYTPKVIVERGSASSSEDRESVTANLPPVDLIVSQNPEPSAGAKLIAGYSITFDGTVKNSQQGQISSAFNNQFKIDVGNNGSFDVFLAVVSIASLEGEGAQKITSPSWNDIPAGTHRIVLCADTPNPPDIDESNETNNCSPVTENAGVFTVANQTLSISSFTATPDTGIRPLEVSLSASVSGTALGNTNYSFWWDCANTATTISGASSACGNLPTGVPAGQCVANDKGAKCEAITESSIDAGTYAALKHTYASQGTYRPKVVVEKGSAPSTESRTSITANLPPIDLIISANPAPSGGATLVKGYSITFTGTIKNNEEGDIAKTFSQEFRIDVNNDGPITPNVVLPLVNTEALGGNSESITTSSAWKDIPSGTHRVILCTDKNNTIDEGNENNNCSPETGSSGVFTVTEQSSSVSISTNPSSGVRPLPVSLGAEVTGTALGSVNYGFWWNCNDTASTMSDAEQDCGMLPSPATESCAANDKGAKCNGINSTKISAEQYPELKHTYATPGTYHPKVVFEQGSSVPRESRGTVNVSLPPHDLTIFVNPSPTSANLTAGYSATFTGSIKNSGTANLGKPFNAKFKIDINNDGNASNDVTLQPDTVTSLAAGASQSVSATWDEIAAGTHRVILCADKPNPPEVDESNETNNCSATSGTVGIFTVSQQTLSVKLTSGTSDKVAPANVILEASVSGNALGNINYSFWWNCNNPTNSTATAENTCGALPAPQPGFCVRNDAGARCTDITTPTRGVSHIYNDGGTYNPKVIVERGSAIPSEDRDQIIIPAQTLSIASFTATPNSGIRPLEVSLAVETAGSALGTANYSFWWNCSSPDESVGASTVTCGVIPNPAAGQCAANDKGAKCTGMNGNTISGTQESALRHIYPTPGNYKPKVIVEKGSAAPAGSLSAVTVTLPPYDLTVSTNPTPAPGTLTDGRDTTFTGTIKNLGTSAISQQFNNQFRIDINNDGNPGNDITLPTVSVNSIGASGSREISATWNNMKEGTHRIILCADNPNPPDIDEANEGNNCSPVSGSAGVFTVEKQTIIGTFNASAPATPAPVNATLSTQVTGGTAEGPINYSYWWDCSSTSADANTTEKLCGDLPAAPKTGECFVNDKGARCRELTVASHTLTHTYADGGTYVPKVIIEREKALPIEKRQSLTTTDQTLGISFSATPNSGVAPITSTLSASITSGTAAGPANYSFWWNCDNATTDISEAVTACGALPTPAAGSCVKNDKGAKCNSMPDTTVGVDHEYDAGIFKPKVIVERGSSKAVQRQTNISTSAQELGITLSATPKKGVVPTNVTLSAAVSGNAQGTVNYSFWWNCSNTSTSISATEAACGSLTNPQAGTCVASKNGYKCAGVSATTQTAVHQYDEEGDFTPKVIAERGNAPAAAAQTPVEIDPQQFTLSLTANPNSGLEPLSSVLSAQITGNAAGTINYSFWWDCSNATTKVSEAEAACGDIPSPPAGICAENAAGKKCDGILARTLDSIHTYTEDENYTPKAIVEWGTAPNKEARAPITVSPQTLTTTLSASPSSGQAQFNTTLTAETKGTAKGTINYSFWWDCEENGSNLVALTAACGSLPTPLTGTCAENSQGVKCLSMPTNTQRIVHTYVQPKTYHPKVVTERGAAPASEASTTIAVSTPPPQNLSVTLITDTANGVGSVNAKLKATTGGDAQGFNTYYMWWDCDRDTTNPNAAIAQCGALPEMPDNAVCTQPNQFGAICNEMVDAERVFNHTYLGPQPGEPGPKVYHPKVIVSRGKNVPNATAITSIMISRPPLVPVNVLECNDGLDNNGNNLVDYPADPGCGSLEDPKEDNVLIMRVGQCDDGFDNDGDGKIDYPDDPGCSSPIDDAENDATPPPPTVTIKESPTSPPTTMPLTECNDGLDNNGNNLVDYPADPGCGSLWDIKEDNMAVAPLNQCNDGLDNDGDGKTDFPADPDCRSQFDADERGHRRPTFREVSPGQTQP